MGILLDIVPNHMAVGGADNPYWLDLMEKGRDSVFATMFDIDWDAGQPSRREETLVVPMWASRSPNAYQPERSVSCGMHVLENWHSCMVTTVFHCGWMITKL